jgi:hypothetical protein
VAPTRETKSIDRRLILKGLAIGAAAAALPGIARTSAWDLASDRHLEPVPSVWEQISSLARWAPTPHNTQPFRLIPRDDRTADIVILTERMLPREDHGNRYGGNKRVRPLPEGAPRNEARAAAMHTASTSGTFVKGLTLVARRRKTRVREIAAALCLRSSGYISTLIRNGDRELAGEQLQDLARQAIAALQPA